MLPAVDSRTDENEPVDQLRMGQRQVERDVAAHRDADDAHALNAERREELGQRPPRRRTVRPGQRLAVPAKIAPDDPVALRDASAARRPTWSGRHAGVEEQERRPVALES